MFYEEICTSVDKSANIVTNKVIKVISFLEYTLVTSTPVM